MKPFTGTVAEWDAILSGLPEAHLLQTGEWAALKSITGWEAHPFIWEGNASGQGNSRQVVAAAMLLEKHLRLGGFAPRLSILYVPKGPILDWQDTTLRSHVLNDLAQFARRQRAIFIKIDPDVRLGTGIPGGDADQPDPLGLTFRDELAASGWVFSTDQIQFRNSVLLDLVRSEDEILSAFKQKTRYNINLASRKGLQVRQGTPADLESLYKLYAETSVRDGFVIRDREYYLSLWESFLAAPVSNQAPFARLLVAEFERELVSAVFIFIFAGKAYYLYGMSSDRQRALMPNHLLQWEAIQMAKSLGCTVYDLWGAPDEFNEQDPLWGVFRFKSGLGGTVIRTLGAWDLPLRPFLFSAYTRVLPRILDLMRRRGKDQVRRLVEG